MLKPVLIFSIILFAVIGDSLNQGSAEGLQLPEELEPVRDYGRCITRRSQKRALCLATTDCKVLSDIVWQNDLLYLLTLATSHCGFYNSQALVCCPETLRQKKKPIPTTIAPQTSKGLLPSPGECGDILPHRVYGANITKIDEYPWTALIEYLKPDGSKGHHCGGSLINSRYVITASHCVNGADIPPDWRLSGVRLGEWDTNTNPDCEIDFRNRSDCVPEHLDIPVEAVILHPEYEPRSKNQVADIALLRLARNVDYTDFIKPVCLPLDNNLRNLSFAGLSMDVAGWGRTQYGIDSNRKLKATVEGKTLEECRKVYASQEIVLEDSQICAGPTVEGIDSCRGGSGGPLVLLNTTDNVQYSFFLVGIQSFGPTPCGLSERPGVYTRVSDYVDWIQETIKA